MIRLPASLIAGGVTAVLLLAIYLGTAAPDLTFWDASELVTAAQTLGIPHPPGTPLWVLLGHLSATVFSNTGPVRAVTMLSVIASALAGGVGAGMLQRWIGARGAVAAAVAAGTMWSVWNNATEAEVYAVALLASALLLAAGERAGRRDTPEAQRQRWRAVMAFVTGLAVPLHLSILVALPASIAFAWRGPRPRFRDVVGWLALALLGLSAVAILPLLAARGPILDAGHPVTLSALLDVVQRKQYAVAGLWPRTVAWWVQLGNVFEWADWQVAYGLHPMAPPSLARTALTVVWGWLGVLGLRTLWRYEARVGRAMALLLLSGTVGVAVWLNMAPGPSFGAGVVPSGTLHEARERDYFFVLGFWAWGLCAGAGLAAVARVLTRRVPGPLAVALGVLPLIVAAVPLLANRQVADRRIAPLAMLPRTIARQFLDAVPPNGVLLTAGDNDSFPLWYLQQVEQVRPDVQVITVPLLGARWYRDELARRADLLPAAAVADWPGLDATLRSVAIRATAQRRPLRVSAYLSAADRRRIDPSAGWQLEGLVYAQTWTAPAGTVVVNLAAMRQAAERIPPSALRPLPVWADPAAVQMQALLRCPQLAAQRDTLLVATCNGS